MSPRPDVSEERKDQIIQAAINVFTRRGIHQARMDDIVTETGLSKGTLYWYFKSKDDIIVAISDMLFGHELQKLEKQDKLLTLTQILKILRIISFIGTLGIIHHQICQDPAMFTPNLTYIM